MAAPLAPLALNATGAWGLNTMASAATLDANWALRADNCIIDRYGRIASRKGWQALNATAIASSPVVKSLGEYLKNDGSSEIISAAGGAVYTGQSTLTSLGSGYTGDNWKMVNFNDKFYLFQRGQDALVYDGTTLAVLKNTTGVTGVVPQANEALAAYGRLWVGGSATDKTVLYYSDLLIGNAWATGSAGSIDLKSVWTDGMDEIVAIRAFNGYLIIFGKNSILIYQNPTDPTTMSLVEHIVGTGCLARDSCVEIGSDLLFLSSSGLRSLGRVIVEKSMPLGDLSVNVRNDFMDYVLSEQFDNIKASYFYEDGIYVICFPTNNATYAFDTRKMLPDGSARVTKWDGINPQCLLMTRDQRFLMGQAGYIGWYNGYTDNSKTYRMSYYTPWQNFGDGSRLKILKRMRATVIGSPNTDVIFKWAADYSGDYKSTYFVIGGQDTVAEYGVAQYNIDSFSSGTIITTAQKPLFGTAQHFQFGYEVDINGNQISLQFFTLYAVSGRML